MKTSLLITLLLSFTIVQAQQKVKGNREPSTIITDIAAFTAIEIGEEFDVAIVKGVTAQIEIATDSNLHEYIKPQVVNGKLVINSMARIRSKKELKIRLIFPSELTSIIVKDKAVLSTITDYVAPELYIEVKDDAKIYMTARVENLNFTAGGGTKSELNFKGTEAIVNINDNASVKGILDYNEATITTSGRTDSRIDGDMQTATLISNDRSDFNGSNLVVKELNVIVSDNAQVQVNAKNNLNLKSKDNGRTEVHNTPKIVIEEFTGSSVLSKK